MLPLGDSQPGTSIRVPPHPDWCLTFFFFFFFFRGETHRKSRTTGRNRIAWNDLPLCAKTTLLDLPRHIVPLNASSYWTTLQEMLCLTHVLLPPLPPAQYVFYLRL